LLVVLINMSRPELQLPPDLYYNESESRKYTSSSRIIQVQREIAERCIELITLPSDEPSYILDVGCGSGLSGQALEEAGHVWCGCDISPSMLEVARDEADEDSTGDLVRHDMGLGLPFTQATFDGCISVSALQWLCYADVNTQSAKRRLTRFFSSLYFCLKRSAKVSYPF
jgi:18S rRNA (guanine1575-N7)-methyltransferase